MARTKRLACPLPKPLLIRFVPLAALTMVALSLAAGVWWGYRVPADTRLMEREAAFQAAKGTLARLQASRTQQAEAKVLQATVREQFKHLPSRHEFAGLSMAISELGQSEQVIIPGITYSLQKREPHVPVKATMAFKVTGGYAAIYKFIHRLEQTEPYLVIESLDVSRENHSKGASAAQVICNVKVVTFIRDSANDEHENA